MDGHSKRLVAAFLLFFTGVVAPGCADVFYWTNSAGGVFSETSNWSPNGIPSPTDQVSFTNTGNYAFTVDVVATNAAAFFHQGSVTQWIPASLWRLTNEFRVGASAGSFSRVTAASGLLAVTNEAGTAILSVGRGGSGELAIRGGTIVTDVLQATNGGLAFGNGELTTLQGTTVSNAGKWTLGTTVSNLFVWNVLGGTNRIITGQFDYGGLTLGAVGGVKRARLNLAGSKTLLTVPGLDTYSYNEINIRGGARFQTRQVQLGLSDGIGNLVVISDPGSSWINDALMHFGMHAGNQTLIITNGGLLQTGPDFHFLDNVGGNRITVTGSNSWFYINGYAGVGLVWGVGDLDNLILVTNGAKFWANNMQYGSSGSSPGTLLDVADGSLWIGLLNFYVGALRIEAGSGTIDQLNMLGGTSAMIQTLGNFYVGHHGNLSAGELRAGSANATIGSLNGELQLGGWQLGMLAGDIGSVTMTGGRALITNAFQTASLVVGNSGSGTLRINSGSVQADLVSVSSSAGSTGLLVLNGPLASLLTPALFVGAAGSVTASNSATLQINECTGPASAILLKDATLEFNSGTPIISSNAIVATNVTLSFHGTTGAKLDLNDPAFLGRIQRSGQTVLQLIQSTNLPIASLTFRDNDASTWSRLVFNEGISALQASGILVETNSSLAATNTIATISGSFTNRGPFILDNSTLRFTGPVVLSDSSSFQGVQGFLLFVGGLHLPAIDVVVPPGIAVQASSITSDGGKLVINGGGIIPNGDGTVSDGMILFQDGWVTYLDSPSASLTPPAGLAGALGLELIRSTNAPVVSQTFGSGLGGYERLRMGNGSCWYGHELVVAQGGSIFIADPSASVTLTSGVFRVEQGGLFRDDTGGTSHVGFNAASVNASATVSGNGSTWMSPNSISIGAGGSQNQLLVESGGKLAANSASIGGGSNNRLILNDTGATCFATNGLTVAGSQNQFLVQTGGVFKGSQILASGSSALVSVTGAGAVANCSTQVVLSGSQAKLLISVGGNLFASNGVLNAFSGSLADISGTGTLWQLSGGLTIGATFSPFRTNQVVVSDKAVVTAPTLSLTSSTFGRAALSVHAGQLYVTNTLGSANLTANGPLELNGGLLRADKFTAASSTLSAINLRAGKAEWAASDFVSGVPLRAGDGTNLASLKLLGGTNNCRSGLEVRRYSSLTGSGVIIGGITNRGWFSPLAITNQGNLVLDSTSELTFTLANTPGSSLNSSLVVTGSVPLAGKLGLSVAPGTILSNTQSFVLIQSPSLTSNFSNVPFGQRLLTTDRLASFRIDNTGTAVIATDFQSEDLDADGIQDDWAIQHFGISPLQPGTGMNDLDGDRDGDGLSNRNEFLLETDPNDPSSGFYAQLEITDQGQINLHFPYLPDHSYSVSTSFDLLNWNGTSIEEFRFDSNGLAVWTDPSPSPTMHFYRVLIH